MTENTDTQLTTGRHVSADEVRQAMTGGLVFKGAKAGPKSSAGGVKTKAKKKKFVTGSHGSGAAKMKADYRRKRANRH